MRAVGILLLIPWAAGAQVPVQENAPLVRGVLLECDARPTGEFSVRLADNRVLRYHFDPKTYVEREDRLVDIGRLVAGEKLEVLSDTMAGSPVRYARTIHVIQPAPPPRLLTQGRLRAYDPRVEAAVRTGNLTYSGVIFHLNNERIVLHTREGGSLNIQLRKDTRYLADGQISDLHSLRPNMRIYVNAGKDLYNDVEAYQVIWGSILTPQ